MTSPLIGRHIMIVEDDYFLASDLEKALRSDGANVVGLASSVDAALDLLEKAAQLDGAVLDLNLQGEMAFPVAEVLLARDIPFVFATGYDASAIPLRYRDAPRCEKPVEIPKLVEALFGGDFQPRR